MTDQERTEIMDRILAGKPPTPEQFEKIREELRETFQPEQGGKNLLSREDEWEWVSPL